MNTLNVLVEARSRISRPEDWGQGNGNDPPTKGICAAQAVAFSTAHMPLGELLMALRALADALGIRAKSAVPEWNDRSTHAEVLAGFDRAIAIERAKLGPFAAEVRNIIESAVAGASAREPEAVV